MSDDTTQEAVDKAVADAVEEIEVRQTERRIRCLELRVLAELLESLPDYNACDTRDRVMEAIERIAREVGR